jgi:hypothetical protein
MPINQAGDQMFAPFHEQHEICAISRESAPDDRPQTMPFRCIVFARCVVKASLLFVTWLHMVPC